MKAFVVEHYGKDGLRAADVPEPEVGDGDVLVKVSAAGINPLDKMVRNGEFKRLLKYRTPFVLGHDVAGVVTRVGAGRARLPGRRRGLRSPPRPADRDLRGVHRDRPGRRRAQASLADPARGGRGAAGVTGRLAGPRRPRPRASPARRSSSTPAPAAWGRPSSSSPSTSAPRWRRPPAARTPSWCAASAPTSSWTTPRRTSPRSSPATTSCWTRSVARTSRSPSRSSSRAGRRSASPARRTPGSPSSSERRSSSASRWAC